ncbi:hypothetical protein ACOSQ3_023203 [Xanthoceras sorbifolium]
MFEAVCLVGKVLATCQVNKEAFKGFIDPIWRTLHGIETEDVRENIQERLDRVFYNRDWGRVFPFAKVFHRDFSASDHQPQLLSLLGDKRISSWKGQKAPCGSPRHKDLNSQALGYPGGAMIQSWHPTCQEAIGQRSIPATRPRGKSKGRGRSSSCFAADDPIVHDVLHCSSIFGGLSFSHIPRNGNRVAHY